MIPTEAKDALPIVNMIAWRRRLSIQDAKTALSQSPSIETCLALIIGACGTIDVADTVSKLHQLMFSNHNANHENRLEETDKWCITGETFSLRKNPGIKYALLHEFEDIYSSLLISAGYVFVSKKDI